MRTASVSMESFKGSREGYEKYAKKAMPYYLTRPKTPEEMVRIKKERTNARALMGLAVGGGLTGTIVYFAVKLLKHK